MPPGDHWSAKLRILYLQVNLCKLQQGQMRLLCTDYVQKRKSKTVSEDEPHNSSDSPERLPMDKPVFSTSPKAAFFFSISTCQTVWGKDQMVVNLVWIISDFPLLFWPENMDLIEKLFYICPLAFWIFLSLSYTNSN